MTKILDIFPSNIGRETAPFTLESQRYELLSLYVEHFY